jgi:hypothetical protein
MVSQYLQQKLQQHFVSATNAGVTLDGTSLKLPGTPGDYTLVYKSVKLNPTDCDSATVTVEVTRSVKSMQ